MSPTEPPISIYGTLPRSFVRAHAAVAAGGDFGEVQPSHYATLRRDQQLTSSRISLRQLAVMLEQEEEEEQQQQQGRAEIASVPSSSPETDREEEEAEERKDGENNGKKRKKRGREAIGGVLLGRFLQGGSMV